MEVACSFKQSSLIHGVDCKRFRVSDFMRPKSVFVSKFRGKVRHGARMSLSRNVNGVVISSMPYLWSARVEKSLLGVVHCQGSDSVVYIDGNGRSVDGDKSLEEESLREEERVVDSKSSGGEKSDKEDGEVVSVEDLREMLQKACRELEVARLNSSMFENKAQNISETSIALKDQAENAKDAVEKALSMIEEVVNQEVGAKEAVQKATLALSLAEARLQVALESVEAARAKCVQGEVLRVSGSENDSEEELTDLLRDEEEGLLFAQAEIKECKLDLENCEAELTRLRQKKEELQIEVDRLNEVAEVAHVNALKAEEDVANIMVLAEQAVAFEIEAAKRVNDVEIKLQRAEKLLTLSRADVIDSTDQQSIPSLNEDVAALEQHSVEGSSSASDSEKDLVNEGASLASKTLKDSPFDKVGQSENDIALSDDLRDKENGKLGVEAARDAEIEVGKGKSSVQNKKAEVQKEGTRDSSPSSTPKASVKKSSRFFSASFFSFAADGVEFTPASVFQGVIDSAKKQMPKLIVGLLLLGAGVTYYSNRAEKGALLQQPGAISTSIEEVHSNTKPLIRQIQKLPKTLKKLIEKIPHQEINEEEASLFDVLWLLLASVIFVPIFQKLPGGSPVLGYLAAGILIGPYGLSIIRHVHGTKAIAEFGVVFLLFNIGLELSVERLSSMKKYVFGLGSAQVLSTAAAVGLVAHFVSRQAGPAAIVIGNGLALSSTAVVLQVLQERGESTSRHGRAAFSVLLFQDLAVVVLLILIPLISPNSSKGGVGFQAIAEALGLAAVKAIVAITAIIAGGRLLLRPIYKQIAENQNAEIFSANTLLVILGTSLLTARAGLSMALGAFLAGLLLAETEFSLQVESDIAPYRGLLLGLFFMTVGMSIDPKLFISNFPIVMGTLALLIVGKTALVTLVGKFFGVSTISAIRSGLLLAPGGEFAFVAFGEAVNQGIMSPQLSSLLFLVVGISMALTPWLAAGGQLLASKFELNDVRSLLPVESETDDLQGHIIICGFGRVGQIIAQLLSERLIPFVALDVRSDRVAVGRALDLPVYFGDAGSREVLHKVGAGRACAAAVTLDTPGANYRTVWALSKNYPNVKTFVRAHDVDHGLNLEKAGATAVVPETLEPSLQLAAAVLAQAKLPTSEITATINEFRSRHLSELTELSEASGSSLGYGYSRVMTKPKLQPPESSDDNQVGKGTLAI
ncbi:K(+) efflux antiporter 2, chloroplastic-like [Silene latifolia]|uniref:K(+) efflux antiporter 2, chloroplastic-like n=1 Tax=Silene latifolia TaxID=37657 RepID=UPI003D77DB16